MTNTTTEAGGLYKYQFMKLPPELQDEITEGLDTRQITLAQAERIAKGGGYQISGESVRRYYKRLLTMRRNSEVRNAWLRAGDALREMGADKVLQTFLTYMMGQLMGGVESGQIDFPVKDFLKLLGDIPEQLAKSLSGPGAGSAAEGGKKKEVVDVTPISREAKLKVRQDLYGF